MFTWFADVVQKERLTSNTIIIPILHKYWISITFLLKVIFKSSCRANFCLLPVKLLALRREEVAVCSLHRSSRGVFSGEEDLSSGELDLPNHGEEKKEYRQFEPTELTRWSVSDSESPVDNSLKGTLTANVTQHGLDINWERATETRLSDCWLCLCVRRQFPSALTALTALLVKPHSLEFRVSDQSAGMWRANRCIPKAKNWTCVTSLPVTGIHSGTISKSSF